MASTTSKKSRKGIAVALAVLGVAGLSLASAAQLNLTGTNGKLVQSGVTTITAAACQTSTIVASFSPTGTGGSLATGTTFGYPAGTDSVTLTSFDPACVGKHFKVAFGNSSNTTVGAEYAQAAAITAAAGLTPVIPLSSFGITTVAQINTIAQISVTVID
ncbi:hypothetical protein [Cellulomonas sp.]|uniref:hypothetical protein n=1 Tax=Cellulomonas sp. TaxID=40001 RepID=UPI003BA8B3DC